MKANASVFFFAMVSVHFLDALPRLRKFWGLIGEICLGCPTYPAADSRF